MEGASEWRLAAAVVADGAYRAMRWGVMQRRAVRLPQEGWRARYVSFWNDLLHDRGGMMSIIRRHRHLSTCTFQVQWILRSLQRCLFSSLDQYLGEVPSVGDNALQIKNERNCVIPWLWIQRRHWTLTGYPIEIFQECEYCFLHLCLLHDLILSCHCASAEMNFVIDILSSLIAVLYSMSLVYWFTPYCNISSSEIHHGEILITNA